MTSKSLLLWSLLLSVKSGEFSRQIHLLDTKFGCKFASFPAVAECQEEPAVEGSSNECPFPKLPEASTAHPGLSQQDQPWSHTAASGWAPELGLEPFLSPFCFWTAHLLGKPFNFSVLEEPQMGFPAKLMCRHRALSTE